MFSLTVNGEVFSYSSDAVPCVTSSLATFLRELKPLLKGTKIGCGEGGCGACTVAVRLPSFSLGDRMTLNACITPLLALNGAELFTIEGVTQDSAASQHTSTAAVGAQLQERFARLHASQCGFCTPGMVMSLHTLLKHAEAAPSAEARKVLLSADTIESVFDGNLCRCTGYRPLLDAAKTFAIDIEDVYAQRSLQLKEKGTAFDPVDAAYYEPTEHRRDITDSSTKVKDMATPQPLKYPAHQRPGATTQAYGSQLRVAVKHQDANDGAPKSTLTFRDATGGTWHAPTTLQGLYDALRAGALIVSGNGGFLNLTHRFTPTSPQRPHVVWSGNVAELRRVRVVGNNMLVIGSSATLSELDVFLYEALRGYDDVNTVPRGSGVPFDPESLASLRAHVDRHATVRRNLIELRGAIQRTGSTQSRNASSLVAHLLLNVAGDLTPLFVALRGVLRCVSTAGLLTDQLHLFDEVAADPNVFLQQLGSSKSFVAAIEVPLDAALVVSFAKASMRRDNSHGVAAVAFSALTRPDGTFQQGSLCVAGVTAGPVILLKDAAEHLTQALNAPVAGRSGGIPGHADFTRAVESATRDLQATIRAAFEAYQHSTSAATSTAPQRSADVHLRHALHPDGRLSFRVSLVRGLLLRLTSHVRSHTSADSNANVPRWINAAPVSWAVQSYEVPSGGIHDMTHRLADGEKRAPIGEPVMNVTAVQQVTGAAQYVDDIPSPAGCLHVALVESTVPNGTITSIDASRALAVPGVVGYFDLDDVPHKKKVAPMSEHAFSGADVSYRGDVIGVIVAETQAIADAAVKLVDIQYAAAAIPPVFDIDTAFAAASFMPDYDRRVVHGDVDRIFEAAATDPNSGITVLAGRQYEGGQEHFYLEPHALLVVPGENDDIEVLSMTQCVTKTQSKVAEYLDIPQSKVSVKVKRIGGAFGGKEVRTTFTSATIAVAAVKLRRPIRWCITRAEDMRITGGRHPFRVDWRVAFRRDADGRAEILAYDADMLLDGGCSTSATPEVATRALMHTCNAYQFPNARARARCLFTNIVSNTAYRGFGAPQAMLVTEVMMDAVARATGEPLVSLQQRHLMLANQRTFFGQDVEHCRLKDMTNMVLRRSEYHERQRQIDLFNAQSRWLKRGIAFVPTLYGINFPVRHLNQASALACVYTDGTVVVYHAAVEMGQGINTKVAQIAAQALDIPIAHVHVGDCAIDRVPNTSPTAASMGSDLNCMAVLDACTQLRNNLAPVRAALGPTATMAAVCEKAWKQRIPLSATGFYATARGAQYDWNMVTDDNTKRGPAFSYFAFGVAVTEVELDVLTGMHKTLRADLIMDCGDSLNAQVDIGQVEGSFVQGAGWCTLEELVFGDTAHPLVAPGVLHNAGPHGYKVPAASDVPVDFRVELLSGAPNPMAVHGSKAVGEPPLFLGCSTYFALRNAIAAARTSAGISDEATANLFRHLASPLTAERIRMACRDQFTTDISIAPLPREVVGDDVLVPGSF